MIKRDNLTSADNQQGRLIFIGWLLGFVDGEGCFSIGFVKQPDRGKRHGYSTGYQVAHRFVVTQGVKSISCLEEIKDFFDVGRMYVNHRHDNHKEDLAQYSVDGEKDLLETIIPFFEKHPLHTTKRYDFEQFSKCMRLIEQKKHITKEGLIEIIEIAQTMNHRKPRDELIRTLRDYTPNSYDLSEREVYILNRLNRGEDIVPSA